MRGGVPGDLLPVEATSHVVEVFTSIPDARIDGFALVTARSTLIWL